jgi:hypothetical protein
MPTSGSRLALHNTDWPRDSNNYHRRGNRADCLKIKGIVTANSPGGPAPWNLPADLRQGAGTVEAASWRADI